MQQTKKLALEQTKAFPPSSLTIKCHKGLVQQRFDTAKLTLVSKTRSLSWLNMGKTIPTAYNNGWVQQHIVTQAVAKGS